ncbi:MAG TPA: 30S ribosomal protein S16 [Spirochaetota bacterium]|nr:MAG: 30S ribosomal protein S16 [Spirochaetes bacterium ADurb.Bin133]HNZ26990.1 30S ribosomal protein S16 [Spirochaetota bacterium]HOF02216.1 30S ribosomal protein S16 [Spirochaetota bacterium]HOS31734.1 30S ribosomal protein S16 [Spirochaetota bacterium]HOS54560.1 30S ribosomal protein S16 [Spirochaetota bacterium]
MVAIRMKRIGTKKRPFYRIVVIDSRKSRDGIFIEQLGIYQPLNEESKQLKFDAEKMKKWFLAGARPSPIVRKLLNKSAFRFDRNLLLAE